eukprot:gene10931-3005_t
MGIDSGKTEFFNNVSESEYLATDKLWHHKQYSLSCVEDGGREATRCRQTLGWAGLGWGIVRLGVTLDADMCY